jgi:CTP:molybdopterin cytidylyltransferase MocA
MSSTIPHSDAARIAGVILAAGRSSRMRQPKALLPYDETGASFLSHLAETLRSAGMAEVFVIGRADDESLRAAARAAGTVYVENRRADDGQLSSVLVGVEACEAIASEAMLVVPVDVPRISTATVARVADAWRRERPPAARAIWGGRHGHPVIFGRELFEELRRADPNVGARAVVRALGARVLNVEAADPGAVEDVDTPEDYERLFGRPLTRR